MAALIGSGSIGHAATTAANSGSVGGVGIAGCGFGAESPESAPHFAPLPAGPPVSPMFSGGIRVQYRPLR
jgi:hypothetical protein